jgi:hypothetical protein
MTKDWTGWRLVKIPIDTSLSEGFHEAKTDENVITYFFHNQGGFGTGSASPIIRTMRLWMTGDDTVSGEVADKILLESVQLTKNRWESRVDANAVTQWGEEINPAKFDVSSISREQSPNYDATLRFVQVSSSQNEDTVKSTEKALRISYNLSDYDFYPTRGDLSGSPLYFATRTYFRPWTSPSTPT